jgi:hypothetical protein
LFFFRSLLGRFVGFEGTVELICLSEAFGFPLCAIIKIYGKGNGVIERKGNGVIEGKGNGVIEGKGNG